MRNLIFYTLKFEIFLEFQKYQEIGAKLSEIKSKVPQGYSGAQKAQIDRRIQSSRTHLVTPALRVSRAGTRLTVHCPLSYGGCAS